MDVIEDSGEEQTEVEVQYEPIEDPVQVVDDLAEQIEEQKECAPVTIEEPIEYKSESEEEVVEEPQSTAVELVDV